MTDNALFQKFLSLFDTYGKKSESYSYDEIVSFGKTWNIYALQHNLPKKDLLKLPISEFDFYSLPQKDMKNLFVKMVETKKRYDKILLGKGIILQVNSGKNNSYTLTTNKASNDTSFTNLNKRLYGYSDKGEVNDKLELEEKAITRTDIFE